MLEAAHMQRSLYRGGFPREREEQEPKHQDGENWQEMMIRSLDFIPSLMQAPQDLKQGRDIV